MSWSDTFSTLYSDSLNGFNGFGANNKMDRTLARWSCGLKKVEELALYLIDKENRWTV